MLDRSREASSPAWLRKFAPLIGAVMTLTIGAGLAITAISLAANGCDCEGALGPAWLWLVLLAIAVASAVIGLALMLRFLRRIRFER